MEFYSLAFILVALDTDDGPGVVLVHAGHYGIAVALLALQRAATYIPDEDDSFNEAVFWCYNGNKNTYVALIVFDG